MVHYERTPRRGEWHPGRHGLSDNLGHRERLMAPRVPVTAQGELSCGCYVNFKDATLGLGATAYCPRHRTAERVVSHAVEWRITCEDCNYAKRWGQASVTAGVFAGKHARRRAHKVRIYHGAELIETVGSDTQTSLDDIPPF